MWPMILDMSRDECKRILRRLELEAYGGLVSALRAQGELSKEKRKLLQDLASVLNISMERHRAEVRRAVNDEKLATIAEHIAGPNTSTDWAIEGRRLIPLMPRLVPQTAFTTLANNVANLAAAENAKLPPPASTVKRNGASGDESPPCEPNIPEATKTPQRSASPSAGMMVLPSGMSIQVKKEEEEVKGRKRRRSSSSENIVPVSGSGQTSPPSQPPAKVPAISVQSLQQPPPVPTTTPAPTQQQQSQQAQQQQQPSRTVSFSLAVTPVKITITSASSRTTVTTCTTTAPTAVTSTANPTTQKVIIVQSPASSGPPSILQRSWSVPVVKSVTATASSTTVSQPRAASLIINNQNSTSAAHSGPGAVSNIVTISTNPGSGNNLTATTVSIGGVPTAAYITSQSGSPKIRPKAVQLPPKPRPRAGSIVIPVTPNQLVGTSTLPSVQLKTSLQPAKSSVHIKHETNNSNLSGVKLMPVSSVNSTAKILPKPSFSSSGQTPLYVMSTTSSMSVVTRTVPSSGGPRVMTVNTTSLPTSSTVSCNLRPVNTTLISKNTSKPIQALHITQGTNVNKPLGSKPNVIVVQKGAGAGFTRGVTLSHNGKEVVGKVIMGKSMPTNSGQTPLATVTVQKPTTAQNLNMPMSSAQGNVIVLDLSQEQLNKNSVLAEILQASGILTDNITTSNGDKTDESSTEWVEMDAEEKQCVITDIETVEGSEVAAKNDVTSQTNHSVSLDEMDMPDERVVTLEEAVELLGQTDNGLLSDPVDGTASQQLNDSGNVSSQAIVASPAEQVVQQEDTVASDTSSGQEMMEVIGELDPQTGIYSIHSTMSADDQQGELADSSVTIVPSSSSNGIDIFSTALASADINLDTFQYMDEGMDNLQLSAQGRNNLEVTISSSSPEQSKYTPTDMDKVVDGIPKQTASIEEHLSSFLQSNAASTSSDTTAVTVEPSDMDTTGMHIEDFASQKVQDQDIT